jgi:hypothetical protein
MPTDTAVALGNKSASGPSIATETNGAHNTTVNRPISVQTHDLDISQAGSPLGSPVQAQTGAISTPMNKRSGSENPKSDFTELSADEINDLENDAQSSTCRRCKQLITDEPLVRALGGDYHMDCFRCIVS